MSQARVRGLVAVPSTCSLRAIRRFALQTPERRIILSFLVLKIKWQVAFESKYHRALDHVR